MPNSFENFVRWLTECCEFLRNLEKEAMRVLQEEQNPDKYRALMCQKAQFLEELPVEAEKYYSDLSGDMVQMIRQRLEAFGQSASRALELDSVFYMYALLYPENHQAGEPNDLERFTAALVKLR